MTKLNQAIMRKNISLAAITFSVMLMTGGCDWVQDRIPDDYYDRNKTVPADTGETVEGQGGAQTTTSTEGDTGGGTTTPPPEGQGGETSTTPPEGTGGDAGAAGGGTSAGGTGGGTSAGGTGGTGKDGGSPPQGPVEMTFEIPQGWNWIDSEHHTAVKGDPSTKPDYYLPEGKIEVWGVKDGTDDEARSAIQSVHAENQQTCANEGAACTGQPFYREIDFGGIKVYAAISQPEYANQRVTYAQFSKNGKIVSVTIYDNLDNQLPLLETVVTTMVW